MKDNEFGEVTDNLQIISPRALTSIVLISLRASVQKKSCKSILCYSIKT